MTPERWTDVGRVFEAVERLEPAERSAFLAGECGGDAELEAEVRSLLEASEAAGAFLEQPAGQSLGSSRLAATRAGPYELLEEIGRGGMGVVYRGVRRDQGFERFVAVKLVKRGMDTDFILSRFESERRILASLDHPDIARVLDGGSTDDGLPYFVMELIEGRHLLDYCSQEGLDIAGRLTIFRQVCAAIQYAHQRLVIHRDIKAGNILVTAEGLPKLLDFGLAKVLARDGLGGAERTETALRALTPEYASPEQIRGEEITTASDVYSLGVLLYELLTGRRPYRFRNLTPEEMARAVCEDAPEKPSTVMGRRSGEGASGLPEQRRVGRMLQGDLDTIVLHALRKEPQRRYPSVERFSDDIARALAGRPVAARKDTLAYRSRKFLTRHKVGTAAAGLVIATLLAGMAATARQAQIAKNERAKAEKRLAELQRLTNSFLFEFHDAIARLPGSTPARELIVRRALEYLATLAVEADNPSLQRELAAAYQKVGDVQGLGGSANLGDVAGALRSYRAAQAILERLGGRAGAIRSDREDLATCQLHLSRLFLSEWDLPAALEEGRKALAVRESILRTVPPTKRSHVELGQARHNIGLILHMMDRKPEALMELGRAASSFEEALRAAPADVEARRGKARSLFEMASVSQNMGDLRAALSRALESQRIDESLLSEDANDARVKIELSMTIHDIGEYEVGLGSLDDALGHERRAMEMAVELVAADPRNVQAQLALAVYEIDLGIVLEKRGDPAGALALARSASHAMEQLLASEPANGYAQVDLARAYATGGDALSPSATPAPMPGLTEVERWQQARGWYRRSLGVWNTIRAGGKHVSEQLYRPQEVSASLARCEEALSRHPARSASRSAP